MNSKRFEQIYGTSHAIKNMQRHQSKTIEKKECFLCHKQVTDFTYWPSDTCYSKQILCNDCSELHLTPEGHKERTGLESYKNNK